ncbi:VanZ family protein [Agromyces allii]|uniref:VanZ-like domain-containing protein n=1 Tax=Agromyces allii TaxID=393607 RepID=A0ABN2Q2J9_9MICO|nr:VanZ family protein [Agromyces allii]
MNRRPLRFAAVVLTLGVLWLTVGPAPWSTSGHEFAGGVLNPEAWTSDVTWSTGYISEIAFNVAMFVPIGVLAALLLHRRHWPLAFVAGFALTTVIELVQLLLPDRVSDPRDLVMNTLGASLGVLLVMAARGVRRAAAVASGPALGTADGSTATGAAAAAAASARSDSAPHVKVPFDELVGAGDRAA